MKLLINFFIAAALFLSVNTAFAGASPNISIRNEGTKSFTLYLQEIKSESIHIRIQDKNDFMLLDEQVTKSNGKFAKKYNLVNLPDGSYSLEVEDDFTFSLQPIEVKNNALVIDHEKLRVIYKPVIHVKGQNVEMNFLQLQDAATVIKLTDENGRTLYTEGIPEPGSIHRKFNVSQLQAGFYTLSIYVNGRSFSKQITAGEHLMDNSGI